METMHPSHHPNPRRRLYAAATLIALTAFAGAASRHTSAAPASATTPTPTPPVTFDAPSGGPVSFTGRLDRTAVRVGGDGLVRMELVLAAAPRDGDGVPRVPTDLVVVLDRSGSMDGEKIGHARAAVRELVSGLGDADRFALVTYADAAEAAIPLEAAGAEARRRWMAIVEAIAPGGGTDMSAGLDRTLDTVLAAPAPGRASRVVLVSDGLANQGDASPEGLLARARRAARRELVLTTVGVGADFNEELLTALADAGTGNYYYLERATDLGAVFAREFGAARTTVASAVAVEIAPASGARVLDAAGYPLEQVGDRTVFRPGTLFGGQERRVWVTLAVPADAPAERPLGSFALTWRDGDVPHRLALAGTPTVACVASDDAFFARVDVPTWERAVVVEEYNRMREAVAQQVKAGDRDAARGAVAAFRDRAATMNAHLASPAVKEQLDGLAALEADVDDAFRGADQEAKQNMLGKSAQAAARDQRRPGSKY